MHKDICELTTYIEKHAAALDQPTLDTLFETLWYRYTSEHPVNGEIFQNRISSLEQILNKLSRRRQRKICNTILDICSETERTAFRSGIYVGIQLVLEFIG